MKKLTTIRIESEILTKAQELGLNISKTCENAIKLYIQAITNANSQITNTQRSFLNERSFVKERSVVGSLGFEPRTASAPDLKVSEIDWTAYREWLNQNLSSAYARDVYNYSRKYADCLLKMDLSELLSIRKTKRTNIVKALSNLAKFLGLHEKFLKLMHSYALEWSGKSSDDIVIERLTKVKDPNEVFMWIKEVKKAREDLADFMDFMAITGLRLVEAIASYNLIINLSRKDKLNEYYNEKMKTLEHYKFKELFIRRSKKAFISFVPKELVERIALNDPLPDSRYAIQTRIKKKGLKLRFSDIREVHASFMTKYLRPPEIDFIHGRVTSNIFMANYFNPALIEDLKQRVFKAIKEIQTKIS